MELFLQQDWLSNIKSSHEAFRIHLEIPNVHTSRASQSPTSEWGQEGPTAYLDLGTSEVPSGFRGPRGRERRGSRWHLCVVVGDSLE